MIFGIGTDIVRVGRMEQDLQRFGERFAERILTADEFEEFRLNAKPAHFLARRFAAKEAAAKAMGTGFANGLSWKHIGVTHDAAGKPILEFSGEAESFPATARCYRCPHQSRGRGRTRRGLRDAGEAWLNRVRGIRLF